jgi:hypothetical protein
MRTTTIAVAFLVAWFFASPTSWAQKYDDKAELAKGMTEAKISLQRGLTASASEGKPISAKSEMEEGRLQLSVVHDERGHVLRGDRRSWGEWRRPSRSRTATT